MLDFIICAASNFFRMYLINRFVVTFLGKLEKNKVKEYFAYICFYINSFLAENIVKEERKGVGTVFLTTKKTKEKHGIGLKSVRKIVEMYNGTIEITPQNDIFCIRLILYMSRLENQI